MAQTLNYRIAKLIEKIGTNGTKIPEPNNVPDGLSNTEREEFFTRHKVACEYLYASAISRTAEARVKKAKDAVQKTFKPHLDEMKPGDIQSFNYDNVTLQLELRNGRRQVQTDLIVSALLARGWKLEEVNKFMDDITETTKPPLYVTSSTTVE